MIAQSVRRLWRLPQLLVLLVAGLFTVIALFPFGSERFRREAIRRWSASLVTACGVRLRRRAGAGAGAGAKPLSELAPGCMVIANHVSWIDIFAINALCPCGFVAKAEIARWPLVGTLVARTGTMFIERGKRRAMHRMIEHVGMRLEAGGRVAVFAEGTTSDGRRLLPFHANLIEAAVRAGAPVVPVGLCYRDERGVFASAVEYTGDTSFITSVWRISGARALHCEVLVLEEIATASGRSRHEVTQDARIALAIALELPLEDSLPHKLRELRPRA